jgi:tetratricopeptide (TPR) repeat protein
MLRDHVIRNVFFDSNEVSPKFKELAARVPSDDAVNIIRMLGIQFRETEGGVYKRGCAEVLKRFQGVISSPGIGFLAQLGKPSNEILIELGHEAYDWFGDCKFVKDFLGDFCHGAEKQNNPYYTHIAADFYYKTGNLIKARECWNHALALTRESKDKHGEGIFIHNLALIKQDTGDYPEAEKLYRQSLKIEEELGDKSGIASSFGQLGRLAEAKSDDEGALRYYVDALGIFDGLRSPYAKTAQKDINRMKEKLGEEKFQKIYKKAMDDEQ